MICQCGRAYPKAKVFPVHCPCGFKLHRDQGPNPFAGDVGFLVPVYMPIGGTETWHRSLLPRLRSVAGFVCIHPSPVRQMEIEQQLGCAVGSGVKAAMQLVAKVKVLVVWNIGPPLKHLLSGMKCKVIAVSHGGPENAWNTQGLLDQAEYTDHIVTVSRAVAGATPPGIPVTRIPNAPDPHNVRAVNRLAKPKRKVAVVCTRFSREKRLEFLASVFRYMPDWELWLIGYRGGVGATVINETDNVKVFPATSTPGDYYAVADVALCASENEGYGLASAEALLAGLPLVSTPVGFLEDRPELATIVGHDASVEDWAAAIRAAKPKPTTGLDRIEDFVLAWQRLIDSMLPEGHRKAAVCRSNICGHYRQAEDACGVIAAMGRPGRISYLYQHPATRCVAEQPFF